MFNIFRKWPHPNYPLVFKSSQDAFEYACEFMPTEIKLFIPMTAMVLDGRKIAGTKRAVARNLAGEQRAVILVAGDRGGFQTIAPGLSSRGPYLRPGDLIEWLPASRMEEVGEAFEDRRSAWLGAITRTLWPELGSRGWRERAKFRTQ